MYKHGVYGVVAELPNKQIASAASVPVYVGTAPVHLAGSDEYINKPVVLHNMAEAIEKLGYSDDWSKYTLCEAMDAHFEKGGIGPIVCINVFDPSKNKNEAAKSVTANFVNGMAEVADAEACIIRTLKVTAEGGDPTYELGTDYTVQYSVVSKKLRIYAVKGGKIAGDTAVKAEYNEAKPETVTQADVIGTTDGAGVNTGLYAIADIYQVCALLPCVVLAPGFSHIPEVRAVMQKMSKQVAGHWDFMFYTDIPLADKGAAITLKTANDWKVKSGYNADNEKVFFPMWKSTEGKKYHLSVLYMVNKQLLDATNEGIPYETASNTNIIVPGSVYFGDGKYAVLTDEHINNHLDANGITGCLYIGGKWVLWGTHTASYSQETKDSLNVFDTGLQMLQWLSNDFQQRRVENIDKRIEKNKSQQIVAEEQARLDALIAIGALSFGRVYFAGYNKGTSDLIEGDFEFKFEVTTSPLMKSLSASISYTDIGLQTIFEGVK